MSCKKYNRKLKIYRNSTRALLSGCQCSATVKLKIYPTFKFLHEDNNAYDNAVIAIHPLFSMEKNSQTKNIYKHTNKSFIHTLTNQPQFCTFFPICSITFQQILPYVFKSARSRPRQHKWMTWWPSLNKTNIIRVKQTTIKNYMKSH